MTAVSYVTNEHGEKTVLLVDLAALRATKQSGTDLAEFLEDLDDVIAAEVSKGQKGRPYGDIRNEILNG